MAGALLQTGAKPIDGGTIGALSLRTSAREKKARGQGSSVGFPLVRRSGHRLFDECAAGPALRLRSIWCGENKVLVLGYITSWWPEDCKDALAAEYKRLAAVCAIETSLPGCLGCSRMSSEPKSNLGILSVLVVRCFIGLLSPPKTFIILSIPVPNSSKALSYLPSLDRRNDWPNRPHAPFPPIESPLIRLSPSF
ncbi:uncharacterized protein VTP21DRAFT_11328 [Calcarisporiella thermophila]|uniref:uncharacterized protein n=1 Tax=Calcarisporiella thermophila TaxID=911321 RepID=UPI0037438D40